MPRSFRRAFLPLPLSSVCFLFAMVAEKGWAKERARGLKPHVRPTPLTVVACMDAEARYITGTTEEGAG